VTRLEKKPFALIGVACDADGLRAQKMHGANQANWRACWNGPNGVRSGVLQAWGMQKAPAYFLINERGVIRGTFPDITGMDAIVNEYLAAAEKKDANTAAK
jgi:hypothetical protein